MKYECNFILGMNLCYKYNGTDEFILIIFLQFNTQPFNAHSCIIEKNLFFSILPIKQFYIKLYHVQETI
jgi:hypothetical protein